MAGAPAWAQFPQFSLPWARGEATSSPWSPPEAAEPSKPSVGQRVKGFFTESPLVALLNRDRESSPEQANQALPENDTLNLAVATGKPDAKLLVSMAQLNEQQGNVEAAREHFRRAIALAPNDVDVLLNVARLEDRQGRLEVAELLYRRAVSVNPESAPALNDLGLCISRQGRVEQSVELLQQAIQLQPQKALYRNNLATVLIELGRDQEALSHLSTVHGPAVANYNMGQLLVRRGRAADAPPYFMTALEFDPAMEPARVALTLLQASQAAVQSPLTARPPVSQQPAYGPYGQGTMPAYVAPGQNGQNVYVADQRGGGLFGQQQATLPGTAAAGMPAQQGNFYGSPAPVTSATPTYSAWPTVPAAAPASRHLPAVDAGR